MACSTLAAVSILMVTGISVCEAKPPDKADCSQSATDAYDKLKCRHDSVGSQIEHMAGIFATGTLLGDQLTAGQRGQLTGIKMKTEQSRKKSGAADFRKLAKSEARSNKKNCYRLPYDPGGTYANDANRDGICDYDQGDANAKCAAIELDADGNLQICNPAKKNKGKGQGGTDLECDQICDPEAALTADEGQEMLAEAAPMDEVLGGLESDLHKMNQDLESINGSPAMLVSRTATASASCNTPSTTPGLDIAAGILRQVSVTARGLAGMSGTGCEQTAVALGFGGNGSVVCLVFETAASVLEIAYTTVDEILKAEESALQASTLACLQQVQGDISQGFTNLYNQHSAIMANDNANTTRIQAQIEQLRQELLRVMSTPLGQRSDYPVK